VGFGSRSPRAGCGQQLAAEIDLATNDLLEIEQTMTLQAA